MIKKKYLEILLENERLGVEPYIVKLFKILNQEKKNHKSRASLLNYIKSLSPFLNLPKGYELFLLDLYLLNYRKDGDYSDLTRGNYVDPRKQPGKTTSNEKSYMYATSKMPFKGSNLHGYWDKDPNGNEYYIVKSYGWYPIYIFKDDKWFEVTKRYSSSTGKQMSRSNPVEWDDRLNDNVYLFTPDEMENLMKGIPYQDIVKNKVKKLKSKEDEFKSGRTKSINLWGSPEMEPSIIKYKINSIKEEGDKAIVVVDVIDVVKRKGRSALPTPENYTKGELRGIDINFVEDTMKKTLSKNFSEYLGPYLDYYRVPTDTHNIKFEFIHKRK